jgi:hypothetical protein
VKRLLLAGVAGAVLAAGCAKREFRISGTVTIASVLQHRAPKDNTVMFIVAKNRGDVPVAVHRIVNPQFPVDFTLGPDDLIVPDLPADTPLRIEVEMNSHGAVGRRDRGDLEGRHPNLVYPGERHIHVVIDRQI